MDQTVKNTTPLISAETNPEKFIRAMSKSLKTIRIVSIVAVICGLFFVLAGFAMIEEQTPYSHDEDMIIPLLGFSMGVLSLLIGLFATPFAKANMRKIAQNQELNVYEDHIAGRATRISGSAQMPTDFYETYDKISSISTTETQIIINLKGGNSIRCIALNAQDLAEYIRGKIV